jgi:nucleoid-associated protein YgaU
MFARVLLVSLIGMALAWSVLARTSDGAGQPATYVVQPGDTLWSIAAERYSGDPREGVWKLQRVNRLGTTIRPGQRLLVP